MKELLEQIDKISKYGLTKNVDEQNKIQNLEKYLVNIYNSYFDIDYVFDDTNYPEFDNKQTKIRENIVSNFPKFGYYKILDKVDNIYDEHKIFIADPIDDLNDIIVDLLETKWRMENTSENDAKWFFKFTFEAHLKAHILNLLIYLSQINE